jgi:hypothetical protein
MSELKPFDEFMDALVHCDTVKVVLTGCGESTFETKPIHEGICALANRRAQPENARQRALQTGVCPMCEDCPDGCPIETPNDSRNKMTNADRIRSMTDEELARWLVGATVCERVCHEDEYCHGNECVKRVTDWLKQPSKTEGGGRNEQQDASRRFS